MEILFILIPISVLLVTVAVLIFRWAVKSGQYDDLEGPAHSILFEDDQHMIPKDRKNSDIDQHAASVDRHNEPQRDAKKSTN